MTNVFVEMSSNELLRTEGGLVITIGALTITGAAIAKGATAVGTSFAAGAFLGRLIRDGS